LKKARSAFLVIIMMMAASVPLDSFAVPISGSGVVVTTGELAVRTRRASGDQATDLASLTMVATAIAQGDLLWDAWLRVWVAGADPASAMHYDLQETLAGGAMSIQGTAGHLLANTEYRVVIVAAYLGQGDIQVYNFMPSAISGFNPSAPGPGSYPSLVNPVAVGNPPLNVPEPSTAGLWFLAVWMALYLGRSPIPRLRFERRALPS
jgi:hypothetical protein